MATPFLTNGILPSFVAAQASGANTAGDFVGYGANGVVAATYSSTDLTTSDSTMVVNQTTPPTITGNVAAYALRTNQAINLSGNTLTLGNGTGTAGLMLNSGSVNNGTVSFGGIEGTIYAGGTATIGANVTNGDLTVFGPGSLSVSGAYTNAGANRTITNNITAAGQTFTLGHIFLSDDIATGRTLTIASAGGNATTTVVNGTIADFNGAGGQPGTVMLSSSGTVQLNGLNTYSGGTNLSGGRHDHSDRQRHGRGTGAVTAGPFGTGPITTNNGTNQHLRPVGGDRTIANAIIMTFGFAMDNAPGESFNLTLSGPITMQSNGRFVSNGFATAPGTSGGALILGSPRPRRHSPCPQ